MAAAGSDREPLLGTAILSTRRGPFSGAFRGALRRCFSEMGVDVGERQAVRDHEDLQVVEQLRDLLGGALVALELGGHPDLGGLLDDLLADRMDAGVQLGDGARSRGPGGRLLGELSEQRVERLHARQGRRSDDPTRSRAHFAEAHPSTPAAAVTCCGSDSRRARHQTTKPETTTPAYTRYRNADG